MQSDVAAKVSNPVECKGAFSSTRSLKGCLVAVSYLAFVYTVFQDYSQSPVSFVEIAFVRSPSPKRKGWYPR